MYNNKTIDIVIPAFRLDEHFLLPLIHLSKPSGWVFNYYIIVDNPRTTVSESIATLAANNVINLYINQENMGAAISRNRGIEAGSGEWILFLDDDIVADDQLLFAYTDAIENNGYHEIGFIGLVVLPPANTNFTAAMSMDEMMDIFRVAEKTTRCAWGATANFLINRKAIGNTRFSLQYPKFGGGEDVDFFLKVRANNRYLDYKTLSAAVAYHPWWKKGEPDFARPFRYGIGGSFLSELNSTYKYYDFLNTAETLCLLIAATLITIPLQPNLSILLAEITGWVLASEIVAAIIKYKKKGGKINVPVLMHLLLIRLSYQLGVLWGNLSRLRLNSFGERFDYSGKKGKNAFLKFNTYKISKWILYLPVIYVLMRTL